MIYQHYHNGVKTEGMPVKSQNATKSLKAERIGKSRYLPIR